MKWLIGIVVACLLVVYVFSGGPTFTYRYRLTIAVDTPSGIKTGSSVIETWLQNNHDVKLATMEGRKFIAKTRGEAVFVDLGEGKHVIALLAMGRNASGDPEFRRIVPESLGVRPYSPQEAIPALVGAVERRAVVSVPSGSIPTLVSFRSLIDPRTAEVVEPAKFASTFGPGYVFREAKVELVPLGWWPRHFGNIFGDQVTYGIERKLPWVANIKGYLSGEFACNSTTQLCLDVGQFRRL